MGQQPFVGGNTITFSPDGRWVAFLPISGTHGFQNATVVPLAGGEARPVSFLANSFARTIAWSRDGTYLLFASAQRTEPPQLARVDLVPRTPHFREDQFRDLFREQQPPTTRPATQPQQPSPAATDSSAAPAKSPLAADSNRSGRATPRAATKPVSITFDRIRERLSLVPVDVDVSDVKISPDGKSALLTASSDSHVNLYVYPLDELASEPAIAKQITSTPGRKSDAQWSPDGKEVYYVEDGRINVVTVDSRATKPLAVSADMDVDFAHEKTEVFDEAWSYLRDNFFNPTMNGVDWNAVHAAYASRIAGAQSQGEMRRILALMVGELNSSHSGIGGPPSQKPYSGRVGLRFDRAEYERSGRFHITDVVPLSPAAIAGIHAGEYLTHIDSVPLTGRTNVDELLANRIGRRTVLGVAPSATGATRDVAVLPVNATTEKGLVYRAWVEQNRAYVAKASGGKLGYVHMFDMSQDALKQLYLDLDAENMTKEGVVIDVRNNNGGFVNAYALDVLARQPYLVMTARGRTAVPARTQLGQRALERPTALVVNQHTLSDGEDFTEGYEALHLGPVIGEPTAGWIVFTSNFTLIDSTTVRIPFARITDTQGRDMEMHPRPVDVEVQRPIGSSYRDSDPQLDAAVRALLQRVDTQRTAAKR
jgi:C-terminal processing protease CtpA/Prc